MISTKIFVSNIFDVPTGWIFEYYLNLNEKLTGQNVKILSVFNRKDKVPSMIIYCESDSKYKFKDFSSGIQGDSIELVKHLFNLGDRNAAASKIITDYEEHMANNTSFKAPEIIQHDKFKVVDYEIRHWNNLDQRYWMKYHIGSKLLEHYNVAPLSFFTMEKREIDDKLISFKFQKPYVYGYFREDGSLYKIYMPMVSDKKFIKIQNYTQGLDQLSYDKKYLLIVSSLKDLMAFIKLGISNIECIAPDSENTMLGESIMSKLKSKYSKIIVLFDNDEPGIKAAERYKTKYGINNIILDMSKDLSDSVKDFGIEAVREKLFPLLKQAL
jgi:hypothetical protein